jgi:hypothetical protein
MRMRLVPIVGFGIVATIALIIALIAVPERRDLVVDLYVLALGGIAVLQFVGLTRRPLEPGERLEFDDALRSHVREPTRIAERDKLAREVELGGLVAVLEGV